MQIYLLICCSSSYKLNFLFNCWVRFVGDLDYRPTQGFLTLVETNATKYHSCLVITESDIQLQPEKFDCFLVFFKAISCDDTIGNLGHSSYFSILAYQLIICVLFFVTYCLRFVTFSGSPYDSDDELKIKKTVESLNQQIKELEQRSFESLSVFKTFMSNIHSVFSLILIMASEP